MPIVGRIALDRKRNEFSVESRETLIHTSKLSVNPNNFVCSRKYCYWKLQLRHIKYKRTSITKQTATKPRNYPDMKNSINKKLLHIIPAALLLLTACKKNDNPIRTVIKNDYNLSLSAASKNYDYVAIDVDNDKVTDFKIYAYNSTYGGFTFETLNNAYIVSSQDSTFIALTKSFTNYGWFQAYTFNSFSMYYPYARGFDAGAVIGPGIPDFATAIKNTANTVAFERAGKTVDYLSSSISPNRQNSQFNYDEVVGEFYNATQYMGFSMLKADGRHYGWIKISTSNSNLNVQAISSGYSTVAGQSITTN